VTLPLRSFLGKLPCRSASHYRGDDVWIGTRTHFVGGSWLLSRGCFTSSSQEKSADAQDVNPISQIAPGR